MLSDEVLDKVIDRVVRRIEQGNTYVLEQIGKTINKIGKLTPSKAYQLEQMLKYGGDFNKIVKELSRITNLNVNDIYKIFEEVAKSDYNFAKQFYNYRGRKFIPYKDNIALQTQVNAIARQTAQTYLNMANSYAFKTLKNGRYVNTPLSTMYQEVIDKAILSVSQGKNTFQEQMYSTIKELASSGLKTIDYASGRSYRLDSSVRMNLKEGLRTLHNQIQEITGEEFGANMVEISVHSHPALDHLMQGHQFMVEEYNKLQNGEEAKDLKGKIYSLDHDNNGNYRKISTLNCYHYVFYGIAGISTPEYTDEELQIIIDKNNKGFTFENKHYSLYDGEQLLRNIELELRKTKDMQIMGRASGNIQVIEEAQNKITQLTNKYREVLKSSGLPSKLERARVPGYRRTKVK